MVGESADRSLQSLADKLGQGVRPVHDWHPSHVADIDLRIWRDGKWYYQGSPIHRLRLVKLFASVMRRDDDDYYLVTPVEKLRIQVDDAPFVAVEIDREGGGESQRLLFRTNVDDVVEAGPRHPIRVVIDPLSGEPSPYILVRDRLEALISRPVFYQMADLALMENSTSSTEFGVWSCGCFFVLGEAT